MSKLSETPAYPVMRPSASSGLTVKQLFSIKIMQSLVADKDTMDRLAPCGDKLSETLSECAVAMADALIAKLENK